MPRRPIKKSAKPKAAAKPAKLATVRVKKVVKKIVKKSVPKVVAKAAKKAVKAVAKKALPKLAPPPDLKLATPASRAAPRTLAQAQVPPPIPAVPPAVLATLPEAPRAHLPRPGEAKSDWFARIAHDYYRFLYATALSITRNNDDAEDAVQNAVMNGMKRLEQLTEDGAIVSWLAMITRNAALDLLRRRKRTPGGGGDSTLLPLAAPEREGAEYALDDDLRQVLAQAIATLPASYQEVVNARHFRGLEVGDIAKDLNATENNIRVRLFRAYEKLRESAQIRRALGLPPEKRD